MRAFVVAVNFSDLLSLTLPYNRHHFTEYNIITDLDNYPSVLELTKKYDVRVFATNSFYSENCPFRKWMAIEEALDHFGRHDWIVMLDADICWPKELPSGWRNSIQVGTLYTPLRRMYPTIPSTIPPENLWWKWPVHRNIREWASYSQIFHGSDPVLREKPWYDTSWKTCAGADSAFQMKWSVIRKIRPRWEVLHLGDPFVNWAGRTSRMADGSLPPNYEKSKEYLDQLSKSRQMRRGYENPIEKIL